MPNTWYPVALANALHKSDLNGNTAEIRTNLSSTFQWYYGVDGNTPLSKVDFASVVLHELGHGLGFAGNMLVSGNQGFWGFAGDPDIYDRFTEDNSGIKLIDYASGSMALGSALTSNGVYFDGFYANQANGGSRVKLYAPNPWMQGSSYSHLDEIFNNTPNALMTYALAFGESEHSPGPVALGIFNDLGWSVDSLEKPDLTITKQVIGTGHQPGDPVTFILSIQNIGSMTASQVVVTDTLSSDILSPSWDSSIPGVSVQSGTYIWDLPDLPADASGVITVSGTIRNSLSEGFIISNSASIGTPDVELSTTNNSSSAIVGGTRTYLPVVLKNN